MDSGGRAGQTGGPTTAVRRLFTDEKTLDAPALNRVGGQQLRTLAARLLYAMRHGSDDPIVTKVVEDGIAVCPDWLPPDEFAAVEREATAFVESSGEPTWVYRSGTTASHRWSLAVVDPGVHPALARWHDDRRLGDIAAGAERLDYPHRYDGGSLVERVVLDYTEPDGDSQLHVDTFFNTHKMWLYLDDVTVENGAFVYVPRSHQLDRVRLQAEYREAVGRNRRSRRVDDEEVRARGLERIVVTCPRNTLVIANTCGYHARSVGQQGATRRALHKDFRANPFGREAASLGHRLRTIGRTA